MERFLTKENAVMSKDFFMRNRPSSSSSSSSSGPVEEQQQQQQGFSGTSSRSKGGSLLVGGPAHMMSKDHFRRRPPEVASTSSPTSTASSSPAPLRRSETWAAGMSSQDVATRTSGVGGGCAVSSDAAGAQSVWASCPGLQVIQKRRQEEELLEKKMQEAVTLWHEIEVEALDSIILEVPSEDEAFETALQEVNGDLQTADKNESDALITSKVRNDRAQSTTGDEEQDIPDSTDNGTSEREEDEEFHPPLLMRRATTDIASDRSRANYDRNGGARSPESSERPSATEKFMREHNSDKKKKRASVLGVLQVDKLHNDTEEPDSEDETADTDMEASKERPTKKSAYGRIYSSLRRRAHITHAHTDSDNDESEKGERKAEKKREKEEKAERKRRQKEERDLTKAGKRVKDSESVEAAATEVNNSSSQTKEEVITSPRRGTIPRNFKMHFIDVFKGGEADSETRGKKDRKKRKKRKKDRLSAAVLSYSEPEVDLASRNRIDGAQEASAGDGSELKKKLKKARKKNKQQEERIKKQKHEIERMRKELERVRRQRKERKKKESEGGEGDIKASGDEGKSRSRSRNT